MLSLLWNYLRGKYCRLCFSAKDGLYVCKTCSKDVQNFSNNPRIIYRESVIFAASYYKGNIRKVIKLLKYQKHKELAEFCARVIFEYWQKIKKNNEKYTVMAVPLHKRRIKRRGFNQVELIAKEFCALCGYDYIEGVLTRDKYTKAMYKMGPVERKENLKDAFNFHKELYNNEKLIIIDDITTTGATFKEIIRELEKNEVKNIICLALSGTNYDT